MHTKEMNNTMTFNFNRMAFLGLASVILCLSMFMSMFAPIPLAIMIIQYGRLKSYGMFILMSFISFGLSSFLYPSSAMGFAYLLVGLVAIMISETILKKSSPMKGIIVSGALLTALVCGTIYSALKMTKQTPRSYVMSQVKVVSDEINKKRDEFLNQGEENRNIVDYFGKPELVTEEILKSIPSTLVMTIFFTLWVNFFILLRSQNLLVNRFVYPFTDKNLLEFKIPEWMVWVVIPSLALSVWGAEYLGVWYEVAGLNLLKILGLFYFFQGYGIFNDFVSFLGMKGILRTFLILFTMVSAPWVIAGVGLFDVWINFRKFFNKKNKDEGDLQ